jgi:cell division transport system permease protein
MNWLRQQFRAFAAALSQLGSQPLATLLTTLAMGVAISLPSGLYLLLNNLDRLASSLPAQPEISVFLKTGSSKATHDALAKRLRNNPALADARFVPRDAALKALSQTQQINDLTAELEQNPLPDTWVLRPNGPTAANMTALRDEFSKLPGVESVQIDSVWAERLQAALAIGRTGVALLAGLFGIALAATAGNAIRALILAKRDEIEVSRLIGATDRYIRRPFLYLGAVQGLLGGIAAVGVLALTGTLLRGPVARLAILYGSQYALLPPTLAEIGIVFALTTALGYIGAWMTVAKRLRGIEA